MNTGVNDVRDCNAKMKQWIRRGIFVWAAACMTLAGAGMAMAEEREKIENISLHIETGIEVGNSSWSVDVTTDDDNYSVEEAEITNAVSEWAGGMVPKIQIVLTADDGYYFSKTGSSAFSLRGEGAEYVSARREDDNTVMILVVRLEELEGEDLSVSNVRWNQRNAVAQWDRTSGAKYYQLRLYRGSSLVTSVSTRSGSDCEYSFLSSMGTSGTYHFEVRAVGAGSEKGDWESSENWYVSSDDTGSLRSGGSSVTRAVDDYVDDRVFNVSNSAYSEDDEEDYDGGPGDDDYGSSRGPGVSGSTVSSADSGGPGSSTGSMTSGSPRTSGSPGASGTSDGSGGRTATVSSGSQGTSQDSYSTGKSGSGGIISDGQNCWYKDEIGWWYHLEDGRYPYNTWELIDGQWYCFGEKGYAYHGWVSDGEQWYFCDLQSGAMLVNAQTPDGFFVGGDGAWIR